MGFECECELELGADPGGGMRGGKRWCGLVEDDGDAGEDEDEDEDDAGVDRGSGELSC